MNHVVIKQANWYKEHSKIRILLSCVHNSTTKMPSSVFSSSQELPISRTYFAESNNMSLSSMPNFPHGFLW